MLSDRGLHENEINLPCSMGRALNGPGTMH
ncbi:hypothetical protein QFZ34_000725 [Phyllobacterium ifriqiyense]|uniref:Uncharacterized protein n=1 Tax=Phyllobacterium ifriqiyense TaxID=314238 RepID=A0ABU0S483_9HYPH|nr:hypothetical protein [Phyllobacterium ifriqiyense]